MKPIERLEISLSEQRLDVIRADGDRTRIVVSTALNGPGEKLDSECTPRGRHEVAEKIGANCAVNTVFVGRRR